MLSHVRISGCHGLRFKRPQIACAAVDALVTAPLNEHGPHQSGYDEVNDKFDRFLLLVLQR